MVSFGGLARKIFGSSNDRRVKTLRQRAEQITALEKNYENLTDEQLQAKTDEFRAALAEGKSLDSLLPDAFATAREAAKRVLGMRPFDVQLIGGMVLHERGIAEMRTGEGKTLMATLPVYLNALEGKGVHVVTVNDYLATRDAETMGRLYNFLGLTVGVIKHGLDDDERRAAYACDITYGTNNELGFDYLRDNMKYERAQMVQRPHNYAIVDEVDSILIDEARTPLIISGPLEDRSDFYNLIDTFIPPLAKKIMKSMRSRRPRSSPKSVRKRSRSCWRLPATSRVKAFTTSKTSRSFIISTTRFAPTSCSSATRTISSAMTRLSSSMNSPAA